MITEAKKLLAKREVPEGADVREFRMAENIYVLYAMTRDERKEYLVKLQGKNVDSVTVAAIATILFRIEVPQPKEVVSEQPAVL